MIRCGLTSKPVLARDIPVIERLSRADERAEDAYSDEDNRAMQQWTRGFHSQPSNAIPFYGLACIRNKLSRVCFNRKKHGDARRLAGSWPRSGRCTAPTTSNLRIGGWAEDDVRDTGDDVLEGIFR